MEKGWFRSSFLPFKTNFNPAPLALAYLSKQSIPQKKRPSCEATSRQRPNVIDEIRSRCRFTPTLSPSGSWRGYSRCNHKVQGHFYDYIVKKTNVAFSKTKKAKVEKWHCGATFLLFYCTLFSALSHLAVCKYGSRHEMTKFPLLYPRQGFFVLTLL